MHIRMHARSKKHIGGNMIFRRLNIQNNAAASDPLTRLIKSSLLAFAFILTFAMNTAWSYEGYNTTDYEEYGTSHIVPKYKVSPPSAATDMCKSLLKSNQHISSPVATVRNQRTAGKVAALGIILGARFALEPKSNTKLGTSPKRMLIRMSDGEILGQNRSALSIAAYRHCQKEYVLGQAALTN